MSKRNSKLSSYSRGAARASGGHKIIARDVFDECEAASVIRQINVRTHRENKEKKEQIEHQQARAAVTLPRLSFMSKPFSEDSNT